MKITLHRLSASFFLAVLTCLLATSPFAKEAPKPVANGNGNSLVTAQYYDKLIAGATPQTAELNLLMNLLPKGGDLHHHYSGAIYAETYIDWVGKQGFCVYRQDEPANCSEASPMAKTCHAKYRIDTSHPNVNAIDTNCLTAQQIEEDNGFYRNLLMRWSDKDFYNHSHESAPPDKQFFDTFGYFGAASGYSPDIGLTMLKQQAKANNLQYLETMLKGAPAFENAELSHRINALAPDAEPETIRVELLAYANYLDHDPIAQKGIADYRSGLAGYAKGIDDGEFTLRFQTYVSRNTAPGQVFAGLYSAFAAAHANPLIVGVNIVGPENGVVAMRDYRLHMEMFHFLKQRFPDVRLAMHAGELTLGMVPPAGLQSHIRDAVDIAGAERIGHGIDVTFEAGPDALLQDMKKRHVAVEICLSSNAFILGVEKEAHPVTVYMRHHVPFVIATDDEGVSRSNISAEYLLFVTRYKPSYPQLKNVVYDSIRFSFLSEAEKKLQIKQLDERFRNFEAATAKLAADAKLPASK